MTAWHNPLPLRLVPTDAPDSFKGIEVGKTGLPLAPHPGSFGCVRKHHVHEGVDLYAPEGTPVSAVEAGVVVHIEAFTGPDAGTPWWLDTQAVFIEGASGVVVYGEIALARGVQVGTVISVGQHLGTVLPVLRKDKGRPMAMLHLELHTPGTRSAPAWEGERPATLLDPTPYLLGCVHA